MRVDISEFKIRVRLLAQAHPFSPRSYRYMNRIVAEESAAQAEPELGTWAGYALQVGYCLRCLEEDDVGHVLTEAPEFLPDDLDEAASRIAARIRTDGAAPYLLFEEQRIVELLDYLIAGEIDRRIGEWAGSIDDEAREQIMEYLAWWTIKGYALRIAERLVDDEHTPAA